MTQLSKQAQQLGAHDITGQRSSKQESNALLYQQVTKQNEPHARQPLLPLILQLLMGTANSCVFTGFCPWIARKSSLIQKKIGEMSIETMLGCQEAHLYAMHMVRTR